MKPWENRIIVSNQYIKRLGICMYNDYIRVEILQGHDQWGRDFPQSIRRYEI